MDLKVIIGYLALLCTTQGLDESKNARILNYHFENTGLGPYEFNFDSSDGIQREEKGILTNPNSKNEALIVKGSYSYTDLDGKTYSVRYTADENGFHPEGDHIKVPPFVPWVNHGQDHKHDDDVVQENDINSSREYLPSTPTPGPQQPLLNPYGMSNNVLTEIGNTYIPTTPRSPSSYGAKLSGDFNSLDPQIQSSLVSLLAKEGRSLDISAINSL